MGHAARRASDQSPPASTRVATRQPRAGLRAWCWMAFGLLAVLAAFGLYMLDPLECILTWQTALMPGTIAYNFWGRKLDMLNIHAYLFNVTNPEEFLSGAEDLHVEEVGPFIYREVVSFNNLSLEDGKASFRAHRHLEFVREGSVGDPADVQVTVPNVVLLAAASLLSNRGIVPNMALRSLASYLGSKTLISLTAEELFWGYDDPLISMAHTVVPSFVDFSRLGFLDRLYSPAEDDVVLRAGLNSGTDPASEVPAGAYSIASFNGATGFPAWGHGVQPRKDPHSGAPLPPELPCDTVRGAFEGFLFPRHIVPGQKMYIYRRQFCRPVPITNTGEGVTDEGYRYLGYELYLPSFLDSKDPENLCYCAGSAGIDGVCLPDGFSSVSPCFYGMPFALSPPHFTYVNDTVISRVVGMNPSLERYTSYIKVQQDVGVALDIVCRLQMNLMMGPTRMTLTKRFNNMALPLIWLDLNYNVPDEVRGLLRLALKTGPALQAAALAALVAGGAAMAARGWLLRRRLRRARSPCARIPLREAPALRAAPDDAPLAAPRSRRPGPRSSSAATADEGRGAGRPLCRMPRGTGSPFGKENTAHVVPSQAKGTPYFEGETVHIPHICRELFLCF